MDQIKKLKNKNTIKIKINKTFIDEIEKLKNEISKKYIYKIKTGKYKGYYILCRYLTLL